MRTVIGRWLSRPFLENPVFVVGSGRSGTSILLRALGKHTSILSLDEAPFISYIGTLVHPFEFRENRDYHLRNLRVPQKDLYDGLRRLCFESAAGGNYGLASVQNGPGLVAAATGEVRLWSAKIFPNEREALGLIRLFPEVKFLYVYRNGCSVVNSMGHFGKMKERTFRENCSIWARNVEKYGYLPGLTSAMTVRQEDLLSQPATVFRQIQEFIETDRIESAPADYAESTLVHSLDQTTKAGVNVKQILQDRPAAHSNWGAEQMETFKAICGDAMSQLGYEVPF